ncbi:MAG: hypothetical protein WKG07_39380 [Hymenobacter sp.]
MRTLMLHAVLLTAGIVLLQVHLMPLRYLGRALRPGGGRRGGRAAGAGFSCTARTATAGPAPTTAS